MTSEELIEKLGFLTDGSEIGLTMYFILSDSDGTRIRRADIDEGARQALKSQFLEAVNREILANQDLFVADISTVDGHTSGVFYYDLEAQPDGLGVVNDILNGGAPIENFNFNDDDYKEIFGYVFVLGNERDQVALYKKHYPISVVRRTRTVLLRKSETRLTEVDDDVIRVDSSFQFLQVDDELFILNTKTLEQFFSFETIVSNRATASVQIIRDLDFITDIAVLEDLVTDMRFAKKLMRLNAASPVLQLHGQRLCEFIKQHPKLRSRIRLNDDETLVNLDTKVSIELFLKLLDDDFLKSELTDFLYEAERKTSIQAEAEKLNSLLVE